MTFLRRYSGGLILAALITLYMNAPWLSVAFRTPGYSPVQMRAVEEDRAYYLSRIKTAADGHWLIGNSALYEHRNDVAPNGFIEILTALIMRAGNLTLGEAVGLTNLLFPAIILFLTFLWMRKALGSGLMASAALLVFWFTVLGPAGLLRESSPKATFIFFSAYLAVLFCMEEGRFQKIARGLLIGVMLYSYHYHWTLLICFEGLLLLRAWLILKKNSSQIAREYIWIWLPFLIVAIPYGIRLITLNGNPVAAEMWHRFGMIETRLPTAPFLQLKTLPWILALLVLRRTDIVRDRESLTLMLLMIAGLIAVNSNIITGREAEFAGHYGRLINMFIWTTVFLVMRSVFSWKAVKFLTVGTILLTVIIAIVGFPALAENTVSDAAKWQLTGRKTIFDWIKSHTPKESVILAPFELASLIPIYTDDFVFMNYASRSFFISNQELMERYLVQTAFFPQDYEPSETGIQSVFGNGPGSTYSKTKRSFQIFTFFKKPFDKTIADFIPDQNKRQLIENNHKKPDPRELKEIMNKYRLDYLISPSEPAVLGSDFQKVAEIGGYFVFKPVGR